MDYSDKSCCAVDYKAEYLREKAKNEKLEEQYRKCIKEYESELDKRLEEAKENRKLKTIMAKMLEEKYLKDGD